MPFINPNDPSNLIWGAVEIRTISKFPMSGFVRACEAFLRGEDTPVMWGESMYLFDASQFANKVCTSWQGDSIRQLFPGDVEFSQNNGLAYAIAYVISRLAGDHEKASYETPVLRVSEKQVSLTLSKSEHWGVSQNTHRFNLTLYSGGEFWFIAESQLDNPDGATYTSDASKNAKGDLTVHSNVPLAAHPGGVWGLPKELFS